MNADPDRDPRVDPLSGDSIILCGGGGLRLRVRGGRTTRRDSVSGVASRPESDADRKAFHVSIAAWRQLCAGAAADEVLDAPRKPRRKRAAV